MSKPERVLQIIGRMDRAGAETFLMNLYRQMDRTRWQFDFIRFGAQSGDYDVEILSLGGKIIQINGANLIARTFNLWRYLRKRRYRVVHAHIGFSSSWLLAAARLAGAGSRILHSHNTNLKSGLISGPYAFLSRVVGSWAQTTRLACGRLAQRELHGNAPDVIIFPNCIDSNVFVRSVTRRNEVRNQLDVRHDQRLVLHVARMEHVKNHEVTLDLAERLRDDETFKFLTIGTGSREEWFKAEISRRNVSRRLLHLGSRDDVAELMCAADYSILPSHYEGFPVVTVEAQAAGLHCLLSTTIDRSVDLGLGLTTFLNPADIQAWLDALKKPTGFPPSIDQRKAKLLELNFDSAAAARSYEQLIAQADV